MKAVLLKALARRERSDVGAEAVAILGIILPDGKTCFGLKGH